MVTADCGLWPFGSDGEDRRPVIRVGTGLAWVAAPAAERALLAAPGIDLFDKDGRLVRVIRDPDGKARVVKLTADDLIVLLDYAARFETSTGHSKRLRPADPPRRLARMVLMRRGFWPFPPLPNALRKQPAIANDR